MSDHYAVIGNPIAHSLSPLIHQLFAEQARCTLVYDKIKVEESQFEQQVVDFFKRGGKGLNITLPFKHRAFSLSDQHSTRCLQAQAANTLWMHKGKLHADNSDGIGLMRDLTRYLSVTGKTVLIIGAGGAVRGIIGPLLAVNPQSLSITNRTMHKANALQQQFPQLKSCHLAELDKPHDLIINATTIGTKHEDLPLSDRIIHAKSLCYDLSYQKNGKTPFLTWAEAYNCKTKDGLGMLVEQAAEAFFIWHGIFPDTSSVLKQIRPADKLA